ncbi:MAG: histidinol-phosphatase [Clostridia bacterium]|nr:histidinol-phosphatase [Clostridia bacterium]
MIITNYHTHTTFCDGKNTAEEMVVSAIEKGLSEIGFSGHSPIDFDCSWAMKREEIELYKKTLFDLREKYKDKIKIYVGIEQDYFSTTSTKGYDYVIGSVHYVYKNGKYLSVDTSAEEMKKFVEDEYNGDVYSYCEDYYKLVKDIYNKTKCQIIGHFDVVTKFNEVLPMIDTSCDRYKKAVSDALSELLLTPAIFEINTGAISRGYRTEAYPENYIIDRIAKSRKPFVVNSDTHNIESIDCGIVDAYKMLEGKSYPYIKSLKEIL